jgi:hypothetical protein
VSAAPEHPAAASSTATTTSLCRRGAPPTGTTVPADAAAIAVAQGALWVASVAHGDLGAPGKDTVTCSDLATGRTVATVPVDRAPLDLAVGAGGHPIDVAATAGAVWVSVANPGRQLRIAGR